MSRRGNGAGSVRQRPDGRWEGALRLNGRRWHVRGRTAGEVERKMRELRAEHARGELVPPARISVTQHLLDWLEAGRADWKPSTADDYASIVRLFLQPEWGRTRLQHLDAARCARSFSRWAAEGFSGGRLLNVYRAAHRALAVAVAWGRLGANPLDRVPPPRARRRRPELPPAAGVLSVITGLEEPNHRAMFATLVGTGCRVGEALGLTWDDVDFAGATMHIGRSASWVGGQRLVTEPKTRAAVRTVALPTFAVEALRRWRASQAEERLNIGPGWPCRDLVFTRAEGLPMTPGAARWGWQRAMNAGGLVGLRLHDLRHLHASLLLDEGHPLPAVSARLGHASPAVTASIYSHSMRRHDHEAAAKLDHALMRVEGGAG